MMSYAGKGPLIDPVLANDGALKYLAGKSVGDLMDAEQRGTAKALIQNNKPTRVIQLDKLDETTLGALMMHFILETIITAHLFSVDPYSQPSVEEGKRLVRQFLSGEES